MTLDQPLRRAASAASAACSLRFAHRAIDTFCTLTGTTPTTIDAATVTEAVRNMLAVPA